MKIFFLISILLNSAFVLCRELSNPADDIRLLSFFEHQQQLEKIDQNRQSGLLQLKKDQAQEEANRQKALKEFLLHKATQTKVVDDSGLEYKQSLREREDYIRQQSQSRKEYIEQRERTKTQQGKSLALSEEEELGIYDNSPRADWRRRKWTQGSLSGGRVFDSGSTFSPSSSFTPSSGGGNNFDSQPTPVPPPPLMNFDSSFGDEVPPPPPPPMFDEDMPF